MRKYDSIPQPFVFVVNKQEPTEIKEGQIYEFSIRLFGQNVNNLPYVAYAIMQAGEKGLGKDQIPFSVERVVQVESNNHEVILYDGTSPNIRPAHPDSIEICKNQMNGQDLLTVTFETPVKYRFNNKPCYEPEFIPFLKAALRRVRLMTHFYGIDIAEHFNLDPLIKSAELITLQTDSTDIYGFSRYSNRQKQKVPLGGIIGSATYKGNFEDILPLLKLAELTHVGKATSFGFGRISLQLSG